MNRPVQSAVAGGVTPGPWSYGRSKLNDLWTVYGPRQKNIAAVHDPYGNDDGVAEANARLIAAAWDTLAALQRISADDCGCSPCVGQCRSENALRIWKEEAQEAARAAIAKATQPETPREAQTK
jgi:hypothetical protein